MSSTARKPLPFPERTLQHVPIRPVKVPSMIPSAARRGHADQKLVERVRREFCDMRGFSPTIAQARRLFHLADDECLEARLFEPHEIPWDELAFPSTHDALREYLGAVAAPR